MTNPTAVLNPVHPIRSNDLAIDSVERFGPATIIVTLMGDASWAWPLDEDDMLDFIAIHTEISTDYSIQSVEQNESQENAVVVMTR